MLVNRAGVCTSQELLNQVPYLADNDASQRGGYQNLERTGCV